MPGRDAELPLLDIPDAIERVREVVDGQSLSAFEGDWRSRWLVERGVEIISEASRRLPNDLTGRHSMIPWQKVAGIGNIVRHEYSRVAPDILFRLARHDLKDLEAVCRLELSALRGA